MLPALVLAIMHSVSGTWGPGGADGLADQRGRFIAMYHSWNSSNPSAGRRVPHMAERTGTGLNARVAIIRRDLDAGAGGDSLWSYKAGLGYDRSTPSVGGTYVPAAGDYNGDGHDYIYWYGTWNGADTMWRGTTTPGTFTSVATSQAGSFVPVPGDFNADGPRATSSGTSPAATRSWPTPVLQRTNYEPNARHDQLWLATAGGGWTVQDLSVASAAIPLPGDFDGDGDHGHHLVPAWRSAPTRCGGSATACRPRLALDHHGDYRPVVGDFDGDGTDDLFWYGPGAKSDYIWWFDSAGAPHAPWPPR